MKSGGHCFGKILCKKRVHRSPHHRMSLCKVPHLCQIKQVGACSTCMTHICDGSLSNLCQVTQVHALDIQLLVANAPENHTEEKEGRFQ